jgi:DNA-binding LacI/PurR family transcriptional regulator
MIGKDMMKRASMQDVAMAAGVSQATVSYVINRVADARRIPAATQKRVRDACAQLDYRRHGVAAGMARCRTGVVGLLFANLAGEFVNGALRGAQAYLRDKGQQALLCACHDDADVEAADLDALEERRVEGVICFPVWTEERTGHWDRHSRLRDTAIFVGHTPNGIEGDCVRIDDRRAGAEAAQALAADGVTRPVLIRRPGAAPDTIREREAGFLSHWTQAGVSPETLAGDHQDGIADLLVSHADGVGVFAADSSDLVRAMLPLRVGIGPHLIFASIGYSQETVFMHNRWWMAALPHARMGRAAAAHVLHRMGDETVQPEPPVHAHTWRLNLEDMGARAAVPA